MTTQDNKQLEAWTGEFGDDYTERNAITEANIDQRMKFISGMLSMLPISAHNKPKKILEVGCNVGANLIAIDNLYKMHNEEIELFGLEPNEKARKLFINQDIRQAKVVHGSACDIGTDNASKDIVFTCGVLIHIHPDELPKALSEIYRVSNRFILCAEYFSPEPRELKYRGEDGLLFTRDFGNEYLNLFPGLRCVGYGFAWKRYTGMDNLNWWVFEKVN